MDIQHLVDRLEDLIDEGRHIPMTKMTMIDEERALEIIDQMRISVPEEIEKASRVINQRDRLLAQANEEAARIIDLAKDKSETLIQRDAVVQASQNRAANIIEQARQDAEAIRTEADGYVQEVLQELETHLIKTLTVVRNGINKIQQDREASRERAEAAVQQAIAEVSQPPTLQAPAIPTPAPIAQKPVEVPVDSGVDYKS
jgi:cell division septum initiation protein DivIVA